MKWFLSLIAFVLIATISVCAQMPLVKASSDKADIRDGLHFRKAFWKINPSEKQARYYVELPAKEHTVTFYTDIDSIRINTMYGGVYNFVILLNGKDSCFTQIIASPKQVINYKNNNAPVTASIPFTLGENNGIYIKAKLNQSDSLNLRLDLGSAYNMINLSSAQKARLIADRSSRGGEKTSSYNQVDIGRLHWDSIPFHINEKQTTSGEDGTISNLLFQDQFVEINYDRRLITFMDSLPEVDTTYSRYNMILSDGVVPMMEARVATKDTICKTWFVLATGNRGNMQIDNNIAQRYRLYRGVGTFFSFGDYFNVKLPEMRVGSLSFFNISAVLEKKNSRDREPSLLGNSILKRFNIILDNHNGVVYLKPNSLKNAPFDNTLLTIYSAITIIVILVALCTWLIIYGIRKRRKARRTMEMYDYPAEHSVS
jgi:hypothetical protein